MFRLHHVFYLTKLVQIKIMIGHFKLNLHDEDHTIVAKQCQK